MAATRTSKDTKEYGPHNYLTLKFDVEKLFEIVDDADGTKLWA
jgi:hypothetical protein